jgi:hypothetical protein
MEDLYGYSLGMEAYTIKRYRPDCKYCAHEYRQDLDAGMLVVTDELKAKLGSRYPHDDYTNCGDHEFTKKYWKN